MLNLRTAALLCIATAYSAVAEPLDIRNLQEGLQNAREEVLRDSPPEGAAVMHGLGNLDTALRQGDLLAIRQAIAILLGNSSVPSSFLKTLEEAQRQIPELIVQSQDHFASEVDALVRKAGELVLTTRTEQQLRPLLNESEALRLRRPGGESPLVNRATTKLTALQNQVTQWMNFGRSLEGGHNEFAVQILQQMLASTEGNWLGSRASIEKLIAELTGTAPGTDPNSKHDPIQLLGRIQSVVDILKVAPELIALPRNRQPSHGPGVSIGQWATHLRTVATLMEAGDIEEAWDRSPNTFPIGDESWLAEALRVRGLLIADLLPKHLKLPADKARRPQESASEHLRRLITEAAKEKRWEEVQRLVGVYADAFRRRDIDREQLTAIRNFLNGQAHEAAGELVLAAAAYRLTLQATGPHTPVADAAARLKALHEDHPELLNESRKYLDQQQLIGLIQQVDATLKSFRERIGTLEAERRKKQKDEAEGRTADAGVLEPRLSQLESAMKQVHKLAQSAETLAWKLSKVETMLGPALEATPPVDGSAKLWLGPDYTVYRTALPPAVSNHLSWVVRYNGKVALRRAAKEEMHYRYHRVEPGNYSVELVHGDQRISNAIEYTLTPEVSRTLTPPQDDDWDRDGVPNSTEGR